jgi:hypothetical protein
MHKQYLPKIIITAFMLAFGNTAFSTGIPMIDPAAPIKVSESRSYSCNDGKAMQLLDSGHIQLMVYGNKSVSCHDDNLWLDGKALSFVDLMRLAAADASK